MTEIHCELLQDRIPAVVSGREKWSADEAAHLARCADCAAVERLLAAANALGRDVEARFDATPAIAQVAERLRTEGRREAPPMRRHWIAGLAAAAAVTVAVLSWSGSVPAPDLARQEQSFLTELDSLDSAELAIIADELAPPLSALGASEGAEPLDLDSTQLERVMRSLEG